MNRTLVALCSSFALISLHLACSSEDSSSGDNEPLDADDGAQNAPDDDGAGDDTDDDTDPDDTDPDDTNPDDDASGGGSSDDADDDDGAGGDAGGNDGSGGSPDIGGGGSGGEISGDAGSGGDDSGMAGAGGDGAGGNTNSGFSGYSVLSASYVDGNSTHWEQGRDIAFDSQGNFVIVGGTTSSDFPTTTGAYDETYGGPGSNGRGSAGDTDVFVSKFDQQGNLIWSTFLGGYNYDRAYAVEIGPNDDVFVAGRAGDGFPTTSGVLQESFAGDDNANNLYGQQDAFITRLSSDGGSLVWSTYVGDSGQGIIRDIDVDDTGAVFLAYTGATGDLPTPTQWGPNAVRQGWDGFYGKLSADGKSMVFGNYMGGSGGGNTDGREPSVRVTPDGRVYFLTWTDKADFGCITPGAFDETHNGGVDLVLAHFDTDNTLLWCTFVGGSMDEGVETHGLTVDHDGNAVIAASTGSNNIPTTSGSAQPNAGGSGDVYLAVFSPEGALLYGSYYGGSGAEWPEGVAVADNGDIVVSGGIEASPDATLVGTQFKSAQQGREGLVLRLSADLSKVVFASPYGGTARDEFRGIDVGPGGVVGILGLSESSDYPTINAFDTTLDADSSGMPDQGVVYLILEPQY